MPARMKCSTSSQECSRVTLASMSSKVDAYAVLKGQLPAPS